MKYVLLSVLTTAIVGVTAILGALHHPLWFCVTGIGFCVAFLSSFVVKERTERFQRDFDALTSKHEGLEKSSGDLETKCDQLLSALLAINAELPDPMKIPFNVETPEFGWDPGTLQQLETRVCQLMGLFQIIKEMLENVRPQDGHIGAFVYDRLESDASLYWGSFIRWSEFLDPITRSAQQINDKMLEAERERDTLKNGFLALACQLTDIIIYLRGVEAPSFVKVSGRGKFASWCATLRTNISFLLLTCVMETDQSMEEFKEMVERRLQSSETDLTFSDLFFTLLDRAEQVGRFDSPKGMDRNVIHLTPDWARDLRTWVVPERLRIRTTKDGRAAEPEAQPIASADETCPLCSSTDMEVYVEGGNFRTTCRNCGHTTHTSLQV